MRAVWEGTSPQLTPPRRFLGFQFPVICGLAFVPAAGCADLSRFPRPQRSSPQALPSLPAPLRLSNGNRASERYRVSDKFQTRSRSSFLPARSATSLPEFDLRVVFCPSCLLVWEALILPSWRVQFQRGALQTTSITGFWRARIADVFEEAKIEDGHTHRFRDTFAVWWLERGLSLENVSRLL